MRRLLVLPLFLLAACGPTEEERRNVQQALPPGCTLYDLGSYGQISHLVAVKCEAATATSVNGEENHQCGKTTCPRPEGSMTFTVPPPH